MMRTMQAALVLAMVASAYSSQSKVTPVQKVIQMLEDMAAKGKKESQEEQVRFASFAQFCKGAEAEKVRSIEENNSQLHKTKLCVFYAKGRCQRGTACAFAHSYAELQAPPDFSKTKPCYKFFRHQCDDANCKYAHGTEEIGRASCRERV